MQQHQQQYENDELKLINSADILHNVRYRLGGVCDKISFDSITTSLSNLCIFISNVNQRSYYLRYFFNTDSYTLNDLSNKSRVIGKFKTLDQVADYMLSRNA